MRKLTFTALCLFALVSHAQPLPESKSLADPFIDGRLKEFLKTGRWTLGNTPEGLVATLNGRSTPFLTVAALRDLVAELHGGPAPQFEDPQVQKIGGNLTRTTYWQRIGHERVDGASISITSSTDDRTYDIVLSQVPHVIPPPAERDRASAERVAELAYAFDLQHEAEAEERPTLLEAAASRGVNPVTTVEVPTKTELVAIGGKIHRVYKVLVTTRVTSGSSRTRVDVREYAVDATKVSETREDAVRVLTLLTFAKGKANLFDPNPMRVLNKFNVDPFGNEVHTAARPQPLDDLGVAVLQRVFLRGLRVRLVEEEGPDFCRSIVSNRDTCLPNVADATEPDFTAFQRGSPEFAGAMAYFHLDRMQRHVASLSFTMPIINIDIASVDDANSARGSYCDCPSAGSAKGFIALGRKGSVYVAEDATILAHEYGHALLAHGGTDGSFAIPRSSVPTSEAAAIGEGFGDYWAFSTFFNVSKGTNFENCYGEWGNGFSCERRYTDRPDRFSETNGNHKNGEIWSNTLVKIFRVVGDRLTADTIILQGHYLRAKVPPAPTMLTIADGIVEAARARPGVNVNAICDVFTDQNIGSPSCCKGAEFCLSNR